MLNQLNRSLDSYGLIQLIEKLKSLGANVVEIDLPMIKYALAVYYLLMASEVSSNMARFDSVRYGSAANGASFEVDSNEAEVN